MKKIIFLLAITCVAAMLSGCYDRDIVDRKEGVSLPAVNSLRYSRVGSDGFNISWTIPGDIPVTVSRPLSIHIQVYRDTNIPEHQIVLSGEQVDWSYTMQEPDADYKVTVKLYGTIAALEYGKSTELYSLGQTVNIY